MKVKGSRKKILWIIIATISVFAIAFTGITFLLFGGEKSKDALFLDGGSSIQLDESWRENEIINSLPDWQKMLIQNGYKLNIIEELGFYLESEVPEDLIFNETLTTAYDSLLENSKKKNLVKVYISEDNTKIAFASEQKIQAPKNCELLFANVWKYASDAKSDCWVDLKVLNLSNFYTDNVTTMQRMFYTSYSLKTLNLTNFNTSKVTDMRALFANCWGLTELDLSNFDLENVEQSDWMLELGYDAKISRLVLPSNWGSASSLRVLAQYDLYDELSLERLTNGGDYSPVFDNYAGRTLIAGDPITYYVDGVIDEQLRPGNYIDMWGLTLPIPNRDHYDFSGWFDNEDYEGTPIEEISIGESGPKTYYGKFTPVSYYITYIVNGENYSSSSYTYGVGTTLINLERDGYTFSGWYENENLTGQKVTKVSTTDYNPKFFYATLTGKTYQIKYYVNGAVKSYTPSSYTCGEGATLPDLSQDHYIFSGWFKNSSCEGSIVTQISDEELGNKTYYANLVPETYNITYIVDNAKDTTLTPTSYVYGTNVTLPELSKKGYTFSGWFTDSGYTSEKVVSISTTDAGNKTFYGHFEMETYTISYIVDGEDAPLTPASYVYGESVTLPEPTRTGHVFSGWFDNASCEGTAITQISNEETGNKTYYANFVPETYNIYYFIDHERDTTLTPASYVYGTSVTLPEPTQTGYEFSGWYTNSDYISRKVVSISASDIGNKTFYGRFEKATYTISYFVDGTEATYTPSSYVYGTGTTLPEPTQTGYEFSGWFDNENYTGSVITTISGTDYGNKQLYGKFMLLPAEFPMDWKTEVANFESPITYYFIQQIDFCTEAPSDYTKFGTLSTGIEVYKYDANHDYVAFVWSSTIYAPVDASGLFEGCKYLFKLHLTNFNTSNTTNMNFMFEDCNRLIELNWNNFDTSKVTGMARMFHGCWNLTNLDLSNFDTSNVKYMSRMFHGCSSLTSLDLSSFDTSKVTNMSGMFHGCVKKLSELDLSNFNTSNVTDMSYMFSSYSLTELDLSNFDTSKVTDMSYMFYNCSLTSLDLSNFNTSNVTNMEEMFRECSALTSLDLSGFDTSKLTDMKYMFYKCSSLESLNLSGWNTSNVTDMARVFSDCSALTELDLTSFDTNNVTNWYYMFSGTFSNNPSGSTLTIGTNFKTQGEFFSKSLLVETTKLDSNVKARRNGGTYFVKL